MRYILTLTAILAVLLLGSCAGDGQSDYTPHSDLPGYKKNSVQERFRVKPIEPHMSAYKGTNNPYTGKKAPPSLPTVGRVGYAGGAQPIVARTYGQDGMPVGPATENLKAYNPKDLMPVKQLIWGGDYGRHDDAGPYRLAVDDEVALMVEDHDELSGVMRIQPDGTVELPLVRERVQAKGRTLAELQRNLLPVLRQYAKNPRIISLGLNHAAGRYYYILGAVQNPGRYPLGAQNLRVSEAIFNANSTSPADKSGDNSIRERLRSEVEVPMRFGFAEAGDGDLGRVYVITPHHTRPTRKLVDVAAALYEGRTGGDSIIQPGQIIFVPEKNSRSATASFARDEIAPLPALQGRGRTRQQAAPDRMEKFDIRDNELAPYREDDGSQKEEDHLDFWRGQRKP